MGTRGAMGVRVDGADKITYNHFDSYPDGLGESMVTDLRSILRDLGIEHLRKLAREVELVDGESAPTERHKAMLRHLADLSVSRKSEDDWYCLTRRLQGELAATLKAGVMIDAHDFMSNSLFCEYAYIVNLDEETFEVYRGFQRPAHDKGRYANAPRDMADVERQRSMGFEYWPVALIATFPLQDIPQDWVKRLPEDEDDV